jgi:flagellar biosynthesis protein FlhB
MSDDQDPAQKTEEPTQRRLEEAVKKGQIAFSREITSFLVLGGFLYFITWLLPSDSRKAANMLESFIDHAGDIRLNDNNIGEILKRSIGYYGQLVAVPLAIAAFAALFSSFIQNGKIIFSFDPVTPKLEKISPLKGLGKMFSAKSLVEFLKGIIKIAIIIIVIYLTLYDQFNHLKVLHDDSLATIGYYIKELNREVLTVVCIMMAIIAAMDFLYQRHSYMQNLRMSKHEIKEEYKQTEGSPEVKSKLRALRMEKAKRRMMAEVPKADVIITNPTHYSIALKYDGAKSKAPICIAKGIDKVAFAIREIAKDNDIPIIEDRPLARAMYDKVELDEEIPVEYYKAVAEIISYVYKIKGKSA